MSHLSLSYWLKQAMHWGESFGIGGIMPGNIPGIIPGIAIPACAILPFHATLPHPHTFGTGLSNAN